MKNKIGFVSLGCCKNLVDAERIITQLTCNGYQITHNYQTANLVIINTCGFINPSIDESFDAIREALDAGCRIIITGCLGARKSFLQKNFPEEQIVGITGPHSYDEVYRLVQQALPIPGDRHLCHQDVPNPGIKLTPDHYAYLKISEGCSNKCTFCAIPYLRGPMISRPVDSIMAETDALLERGVKELMVVAQDTADYGRDINFQKAVYQGKEYTSDFLTLVDFLSRKDVWVRLHYLYPYPSLKKIIPYLKDSAIVPYLDIPLQHSSPEILKKMHRPGNITRVAEDILSWKEQVPDLCIRTSFIVGFPGETDADFENLLDFIRKVRLDRVGCFCYSNVHGVKANDYPDQIPENIKNERYNAFMKVQQEISAEIMKSKIGQEMPVIVDNVDREEKVIIARSRFDSPDIDGNVFIPYEKDDIVPDPGSIIKAEIYDAGEYDLYGKFLHRK